MRKIFLTLLAVLPLAIFAQESFTGRVTKNRVRMRLDPTLDGKIVRELSEGELLIATDIGDEDFYAVRPPEETRAYIYRPYVLDGVVEGTRVNVRLEPTTEAPIIAQLNSGDKLQEPKISSLNSKWLEFCPPIDVKFYICKDYVEKVGGEEYMAELQKRRGEANRLLADAYRLSKEAGGLPYEEIDYPKISALYKKVMGDYADFDEQAARAKELFTAFEKEYAEKKLAYVEKRSQNIARAETLHNENLKLSKTMHDQQRRLAQLEKQLEHEPAPYPAGSMALWEPAEERAYAAWADENGSFTMEEFYRSKEKSALTLRGVIDSYGRNIKNKPGDFLLLNSGGQPIAFLYSTRVNLQEHVGKEVELTASPRPNNHFAYPAYFVHSIEE